MIEENRCDIDGMNVTERMLYKALKRLGLDPIPQFEVGNCKIDLAFPDNQWAIEVNGSYHFTEEGKERDKKRRKYLHHTTPPWRVKSFKVDRVFKNPDSVAKEIKRLLEKYPEGGASLGGFDRPYKEW